MTSVDRDGMVAALEEQWRELLALLDGLAPEDWGRPTDCPGWSVQDNVAHVIGTEALMEGRPAPEVELGDVPHVRNDMGRFNEQWVVHYRGRPPAELVADLRSVVAERRASHAGMDQAGFDEPADTPGGRDTYGRFMRIRVMDMWFHEQDIREAVGEPGHLAGQAPECALAEVVAALGFVVGKRVGPPAGTTVRFVLTGPLTARIDVEVGDRARVVEGIPGEPTVTLTVPGDRFMRIVGGRATADDAAAVVALSGDTTLGGAIVTSLPYMV